jgi:hypothetical protein
MDRGDEYFSAMAAEKLRGKGPSEEDLRGSPRSKWFDGFGNFLNIN